MKHKDTDWLAEGVGGMKNTPLHKYFFRIPNPNLQYPPPKEAFEKGLNVKNFEGYTPMHIAAESGQLNLIPREFITNETLTVKNNDGETAIHCAAREGFLNQIPPEYLTIENLTEQSYLYATPVHLAAHYGYKDQLLGIKLPKSCISDVGQEWFDKNEAIIRQREQLAAQDPEGADIEIF